MTMPVPAYEVADAVFLPWLSAALNGMLPVSTDAFSAYVKELAIFGGAASAGAAQSGLAENGL